MRLDHPDTVRKINQIEKRIDGLAKPELMPAVISSYLDIPGLVGLWTMANPQRSTGDLPNAATVFGTTNKQDLTYNGNPTYNYYNDIVPYIDLDGVGDYLSVADNTDLDILGTETIYNSSVRGLTLGGWFYPDTTSALNQTLMAKLDGPNNQSYRLFLLRTGLGSRFTGQISVDGTALTSVNSPVGVTFDTGVWQFFSFRFTPSAELKLWRNSDEYTNTTAIPASIFNSTAFFSIGNDVDGNIFDGRATLCFLSANALSDALIGALFEQSRVLFRV